MHRSSPHFGPVSGSVEGTPPGLPPALGPVDVRTKANFHELIMDLADEGMAVLLISSDLPEIVAIADRIMVMRDYQFVGEFPNSKDYPKMSTKVMDAIYTGSARQSA